MRYLKLVALTLVIVSALAALVATVGCSRSGSVAYHSPTTTRGPLPAGWMLHTTDDFEIGVPDSWITLDVTPEAIDAMIREMGDANPDIVPYLQALKRQDAVKFWAMKLSPSGFSTNLNVGKTIRILSLDSYEDAIQKQIAPLGYSVLGARKVQVNGDDALMLNLEGTVELPNGESGAVIEEHLAVEHGGYDYYLTLAYAKEDAERYPILFDQVVRTFLIK